MVASLIPIGSLLLGHLVRVECFGLIQGFSLASIAAGIATIDGCLPHLPWRSPRLAHHLAD